MILRALVVIIMCASATLAGAATYYVDARTGDDGRDGKSPETAWKTLAPANALTYGPGDRLLLRAGCEYAAPLALRGSGREGAPVVVTKYGQGPLPHITGTPGHEAALTVRDGEYWEVSDLELSGARSGVFAYVKDFGVAHHLYFRRLNIHDIKGSLGGDDGGFLCKREGLDTWFEDLRIEDCTIERADRNGILLTDYPTASDKHHSTGVVIRNNRLRDIGGDGIFILGCDGALIERNVLRYAHQRVGREPGMRACAGIWPHRCNDTLIQYNEVSHTAVGGKTVWDSEAFDDDVSCRGTTFQYNYSHDNAGGFLLVCGGRDTVVRYNISQNDATATFSLESDGTSHAKVYNNAIYVPAGMTVNLARNTFGKPRGVQFSNNLLYVSGTMQYALGGIQEATFDHNAYYGNHAGRPADAFAVLADPLLARPGSGGDGMDTLRGYVPRAGSPLLKAGRAIVGAPGLDFLGRVVRRFTAPTIGAAEGGSSSG